MSDKVEKFYPTGFYKFWNELLEAYKENRLQDFICIYTKDYPEGEEREGFLSLIDKYWFSVSGKGTVNLIGLVEVMKAEMLDYMYKKSEELEEEDGNEVD